MNELLIYILPGAAVLAGCLFYVRRKRTRRHSENVISMNAVSKKRNKKGQACSKCKQRGDLIFYANDAGIVRGLCKDCRKKAEVHEELYPV
ncbi:hypothetical protein [Paenibacillus lemnae]|uniref:Uncharacterized protein n=1 Tax=Paenibacillus lemnae TaxID=1330551 RepID=A0A848M577_PAELE|nr:hypothetical protein [Paenibacillus lemnae]NMO95262.1 hypothetical protein [Paenibacillus lemnae]